MSDNKNSTRFNIERDPQNPVDHLKTGFEDAPSDSLTIAPCGIVDADRGVFELFNREIPFAVHKVSTSNGIKEVKKPGVLFATGERFATLKQLRPLKDRDGRLILPAISIRRRSIEQTAEDINGRGINQQTGTLTISRRFAPEDRNFQNFLNKFNLKNMDLPETDRLTGLHADDLDIRQGSLLQPKKGTLSNVYEIFTIPQPQFFTATYEVVFWTSFTEHMNYLIEVFMSSYLPQDKMFRINTPAGYWFLAYVDDSFSSNDNFDDFRDQRRVLRYTFNLRVKGYILAGDEIGQPVPVRRWLSSPEIKFDFHEARNDVHLKSNLEKIGQRDKFVLSDLEAANQQNPTTERKFLVKKDYIDPRTGRTMTRYVPVVQSFNSKGESVYYTNDFDLLQQIILKNK